MLLSVSIKERKIRIDSSDLEFSDKFFNLYCFLALTRKEDLRDNEGWVFPDDITRIVLWERNDLESVGKQIDRHLTDRLRKGLLNVIEMDHVTLGPFRIGVPSNEIIFDLSIDVLHERLNLSAIPSRLTAAEEQSFNTYIESISQGDVSFQMGNSERALLCFKTALDKALTREQSAAVRARIGRILEQNNHFSEAMAEFQSAIDELQKTSSINDLGYLYYLMGFLYRNRGKLEEAEHLINKSLRLVGGRGNHELLGYLYNGLGLIYKDRSDYQKAYACYQHALQHWV